MFCRHGELYLEFHRGTYTSHGEGFSSGILIRTELTHFLKRIHQEGESKGTSNPSHSSFQYAHFLMQSEILLQDVEVCNTIVIIFIPAYVKIFVQLVATIASIFSLKKGYVYPKKEIDDLWEKVLLNQCRSS